MSYCRWSTDNFQCDLYVYEDVGGFWSINVASNRVEFLEPLGPEIDLTEDAEGWYAQHRDVLDRLDDPTQHRRVNIDLPHAGTHFEEPTASDAADRLQELADLGYRFPREIIAELRAE